MAGENDRFDKKFCTFRSIFIPAYYISPSNIFFEGEAKVVIWKAGRKDRRTKKRDIETKRWRSEGKMTGWAKRGSRIHTYPSVRPSVRFSAPPLSAGKYLHRLFALCCGRNEIALESPSLFTADLHRRPPPSVCPRGANYDSPLSICQHGYLVARRGGPLLLSKPSRKLLFAHSSSPRGPLRLALRLAFPHASSIQARSSLAQQGFAFPSNRCLLSFLFLSTPESSERTFSFFRVFILSFPIFRPPDCK